MGVAGQGHHHRQERRRAVVRQPRAAGRVAEAGRRALRRHRRRQGPHDARTAARPGRTSRPSSRACRRTRTCRGWSPSAHDVNIVYATFDNHRATTTMSTYVYASVDGGNNFRSIGEGIPKGHTVTSMAEDPKNPNVLYAGHRVRLVRQPGPRRQVEARQAQPADRADPRDRVPPARQRHDPRDARPQHLDPRRCDAAAAVGRGDEVADAFLFDMRPAMQFNPANDRGFVTDKPFCGKNPTYGAPISYYLAKPQTNVALRIRDARRHAGARDHRQRPARRARRRHQPRLLGPAAPAAAAARRPAGGGGGGGGGGGSAAAATTART